MPSTPSTRWAIQRPADGDQINTWPASMRATIDKIDQFMAGFISDAVRPAASILGRVHRNPASGLLSFDTGAAWVEMAQNPHAANHAEGGPDPVAGIAPIGSVIPYAGTVLPAGGSYVWADGTLIRRDTYATFFTRVGHAYNGGVDPGSGTPGQGGGTSGPLVRLPDKRGRVPMGADSFGQGAANRIVTGNKALGQNGGAERITLAAAESGLPSHGHSDSGHAHGQNGHAHLAGNNDYLIAKSDQGAGGFFAASGGGGTLSVGWYSATNTVAPGINNASAVIGNAGPSAAGASHQNLQPYEADNYIVRIA